MDPESSHGVNFPTHAMLTMLTLLTINIENVVIVDNDDNVVIVDNVDNVDILDNVDNVERSPRASRLLFIMILLPAVRMDDYHDGDIMIRIMIKWMLTMIIILMILAV